MRRIAVLGPQDVWNAIGGVGAVRHLGITGSTATFKVHYDQRIDGVGRSAAWSSKLNQLSVVAGVHIFHVTVGCADDEDGDIELAKALAARVIEQLD